MRISDLSSDVCSSDLLACLAQLGETIIGVWRAGSRHFLDVLPARPVVSVERVRIFPRQPVHVLLVRNPCVEGGAEAPLIQSEHELVRAMLGNFTRQVPTLGWPDSVAG